ncbi:acylphosphatase [Pedobacter immunditicola]|uniref:acylphosphatase n=1 Tax=Pedobacter immunditicola TaxID=3133440 RepID=UPI0030A0E5B7
MKHIDIKVTGKVQGVSFRAVTKMVADQMGVRGIIRNESDGSVFIEAEGDEVSLDVFLEWCHDGPDRAVVELVTVNPGTVKNYQNFEVIKR